MKNPDWVGRLVCIINNYNYAKYLRACLDSALAQTVSFDLVIIIDDGSQDDSCAIIKSYAETHGTLLPILKSNAGQLSCFNAAAPYIDDSDLVFFLDADDIYMPDYVEHMCQAAATDKAGFYYCKPEQFTDNGECPATARVDAGEPIVLPHTSALTLATRRWLGSPTSALVAGGHLYRQIFPYEPEADWVIRADDVLIYAASILGAKKVYLRSIRVGYRVHGANLFMGNRNWKTRQAMRQHDLKIDRLFAYYSDKAGIRPVPRYAEIVREWAMLDTEAKRVCRIYGVTRIMRRFMRRRLAKAFGSLFA